MITPDNGIIYVQECTTTDKGRTSKVIIILDGKVEDMTYAVGQLLGKKLTRKNTLYTRGHGMRLQQHVAELINEAQGTTFKYAKL